MKAKNEANRYDKIFKENLEAVTMTLIEKVLNIEVSHAERLQADLPKTLERKPDQLLKITDRVGDIFLLHIEFQLADEMDMAERMLEYWILLRRKYKLSVRQYVLFLAESPPQMAPFLQADLTSHAFRLIPLAQVNADVFLSSNRADEVVFAVLADIGEQNPQEAARRLVERIAATSPDRLVFEKHLQQLRVLVNLRSIKPFVEEIMESITQYFKPENDYLYKLGEQIGEQSEAEKQKRLFVTNLLEKTDFSVAQIAELAEVSPELVEQIKNELSR
ncbi:MAG: hypothetical protein MUD08_19000 [Cytophagales bacterium]|jgi:predicted transposase/invertase (TIGR01784 family)|nr:hypothetical protein [Cytophagales bacterium]